MIEGVKTKHLRIIPDERGRLMEMLRNDDEMYTQFGQVYMTTTYPQVVKAWHRHEKQDDNLVAVTGMLKLVLYDDREGSPTREEINEFFVGEQNPMLVHVPSNVYHGWKCISQREAIVINVVTRPYDCEHPDEHRLPYDTDQVPYDWAIKMG